MKDVALVVVDMLYDFIDGSMACANAENAVAETVKYIEDKGSAAQDGDDVIVAAFPTMFVCDHHPSDHCSFTAQGDAAQGEVLSAALAADRRDLLIRDALRSLLLISAAFT
ncbi:MAG: hypothetical protein II637_06210, partial [Bacteroidales bacterium]|nr:hypothetical protein [Bacteroidales bacterium]